LSALAGRLPEVDRRSRRRLRPRIPDDGGVHVDFEAGAVHFRRSLSWAKLPGEPTQARFFDTKTGRKGNRKVPCPAELMHELKKWKLRCPKGELDLVFPTAAGAPQHRTRILDLVLRPTLERAGLPKRFHMHTLRHSFCSALLAQGTPPTEVQKYSGHTRLSTLLDIYSHFIPSEQTGSIDRLASKVLG
jgi:integrase